ncbi:HNH endonuclease [Tamlana sp. 2201CG12-4]|uniref:HNH endonuclease n=1 Tax=Tamlana sp. 2201CG12-4 TaxID=3112582 RepID=UPI002DB8D0B5|nr:HNH endonuclease [Tamlana sp. 2201CG12-4]MEC3905978.1 HNH endonuclease [Tamlana sp. 2201CG12-4]
MKCIFCENINNAKSIEHIVPESFGNKNYTLEKGAVCDKCNNSFSHFEGKALTNSIFVMERCLFGIATKKGKPVKGKVNDLIVEADSEFKKNIVTFKSVDQNNVKLIDKKTGAMALTVETFDKSESAVSKLLLTMGLESLYKSQKDIYEKYDFSELRDYIMNSNRIDWPFMDSLFTMPNFKSIPTFYDKHLLNKAHCKLQFREYDKNTLLFKFIYGGIEMMINLLNRNLEWITQQNFTKSNSALHPEHYRKKIKTMGNNVYKK